MHRTAIILTTASAILLQGCSSRPRQYTPTLAAPPSGQLAFDQAAFDGAYQACSELLAAGKLTRDGRLASAGGGAAAGGTAAVVGGATAAAVAGYGGLAVASATIVLLPFAVVGGAVATAKIKRAKKERAIEVAMAGCLAERGYHVASWIRVRKHR